METKQRAVAINIRFPVSVHELLLKYKATKPHMSLNAIVVDILSEHMATEKKAPR